MNVKEVAYEILDTYPIGMKFKTINYLRLLKSKSGRNPMDGTALRYLREYRQSNRMIVNVDKRKSIYEVVG